jgi:hypothetical protein
MRLLIEDAMVLVAVLGVVPFLLLVVAGVLTPMPFFVLVVVAMCTAVACMVRIVEIVQKTPMVVRTYPTSGPYGPIERNRTGHRTR